MKKIYEVWSDDDGCQISISTVEGIAQQFARGALSEKAVLLHRIEADTYEEAMSERNRLMDWEPYKPGGEAMDCPNACGAKFYPEGSGECPNCGDIC
jgi:hypothetical protein